MTRHTHSLLTAAWLALLFAGQVTATAKQHGMLAGSLHFLFAMIGAEGALLLFMWLRDHDGDA